MKHEVDIPDDMDRRRSQKASATGDDEASLIRIAIERFVSDEASAVNGAWSAAGEARRRAFDKAIAGTIAADELEELAQLDFLANEHFDRVSPRRSTQRGHFSNRSLTTVPTNGQ